MSDTKSKVEPLSVSLREVTELIVKHHGVTEGLYDLAIQFQVAVGAVGPTPEERYPGAMVGVSSIGIVKTEKVGPNTVDAFALSKKKRAAPKKATAE